MVDVDFTVHIDVRGLKSAKLLIVELSELERDLEMADQKEFSQRVNHALERFMNSDNEKDVGDVEVEGTT